MCDCERECVCVCVIVSMSVSVSVSVCAYLCLCLYSFPVFRYAFTILSNVGVFSAMFVLLEFVHVEAYTPHAPALNLSQVLHTSQNTSTISPNDLWIFSVSV